MGFDCGFTLHNRKYKDKDLKTKEDYERAYFRLYWFGRLSNGLDNLLKDCGEAINCAYIDYEGKVVIEKDNKEIDDTHYKLDINKLLNLNKKLEVATKLLSKYSERELNLLWENYDDSFIPKAERKKLLDALYDIDSDVDYESVYSIIRLHNCISALESADFNIDANNDTYQNNYDIIYWRSY